MNHDLKQPHQNRDALTNLEQYLPSAWVTAAGRLWKRPPVCPLVDMKINGEKWLVAIWDDWVRIVVNLALREHELRLMADWADAICSGQAIKIQPAFENVLKKWREMYPIDLWGVLLRTSDIEDNKEKKPMPKEWVEKPTLIPLPVCPASNENDRVLSALSVVFAWSAEFSRDCSPGLLEYLNSPIK